MKKITSLLPYVLTRLSQSSTTC